MRIYGAYTKTQYTRYRYFWDKPRQYARERNTFLFPSKSSMNKLDLADNRLVITHITYDAFITYTHLGCNEQRNERFDREIMFVIDRAYPRWDQRDVGRQGDEILQCHNSLCTLRCRIPAATRRIHVHAACNTRVSAAREKRICMSISSERINPYV